MAKSKVIPATLFADVAKPGDKFSCDWVGIDLLPVYTVKRTYREPIRNARGVITEEGREFYFTRHCDANVRRA